MELFSILLIVCILFLLFFIYVFIVLIKAVGIPKMNLIHYAYENNFKIQGEYCGEGLWIRKHSSLNSINQDGKIEYAIRCYNFVESPEKWRVHPDDKERFDKHLNKYRF
jgi:hypothetical protein